MKKDPEPSGTKWRREALRASLGYGMLNDGSNVDDKGDERLSFFFNTAAAIGFVISGATVVCTLALP